MSIRILVVAVCRNESAIMPWFLRHYSFADAIHIWDNTSTDGSDCIAKTFDTETPIRWYHFDTGGVMRDDIHCHIKTNHHRMQHGFDWVINVDMDEFLWHEDGVREYLEQCTAHGITVPRTQGYNMVADFGVEKFGKSHPQHGLGGSSGLPDLIQEGVPDPNYSKFAAFHTSTNLMYSPGCHPHDTRVVLPDGRVVLAGDVAAPLVPEMKLLHYRWWGEEHTRRKAEGNKLSQANIANKWGLEAADPEGMVARYRELRAKRVNVFEKVDPMAGYEEVAK